MKNPSRIFLLTLKEHSKANVLEAIKKLEQRADIYCADANHISHLIADEEDAFTSENTITTVGTNGIITVTDDKKDQWGLKKISITGAWQVTTGSSNVLVGVIDTGIYADHPDLINRIDRNISKSFLGIHFAEDEHGLKDVYGKYGDGHGTKVAGIIGAQADNKIGTAGVCKNVTLVSLRKYYNAPDYNNNKDENDGAGLVKILEYAKEKNIKIINYSILWAIMVQMKTKKPQ